jgi:TRAP-type uncharacterized transport system fused permease subunit
MIFFNKGLLLIGVTTFWLGAWIGLSAFGGMVAFAAATLGYLNGNLNWAQRGILLVAALLLVTAENIFPFPIPLDFVGLGLIAMVATWQHLTRPRAMTA